MKKALFQGLCLLISTTVVVSAIVTQNTKSIAQPNLDNLTRIGAVISAPNPLRGQKNRSSGNFNVQTVPSYANALLWEVYENGSPNPKILFDVKADRSMRSDPYLGGNLRHGAVTGVSPYNQYRSIYIANPSEAGGNFQVVVRGIAR